MIAQLAAQYFGCHPQVVGEGGRGGRVWAGSCESVGLCLAGGAGCGVVGRPRIMNRGNSMQSVWKRPDCGQQEVKENICLANHSVLRATI